MPVASVPAPTPIRHSLPLPRNTIAPGYGVAFRAWTPPPATLTSLTNSHHPPAITPFSHPTNWWALQVDLSTANGVPADEFWKLWGSCGRCGRIISAGNWDVHAKELHCRDILAGEVPGVSVII